MESSFLDSEFPLSENDSDPVLLIEKTFIYILKKFLHYTSQIIYFFFLPISLTYSFWAHALKQMWQITKQVTGEILELMQIVNLFFEACFKMLKCVLEFILIMKSWVEVAEKIRDLVYPKFKRILDKLHTKPHTHTRSVALYTVVKKFSVASNNLLFPHFIFEDTFKKVDFQKDTINITVPVPPPADSSEPKIETQNNAQTSTSESLPAVNEPKLITERRKPAETADESIHV